jgi:hypothetical protein
MGIRIENLLHNVSPETEEIVKRSCRKLKSKIQDYLRRESRLWKKQRNSTSKDRKKENVNVPVLVKPGVPEYLRHYQIEDVDPLATYIATYRSILRLTRHGLGCLEDLVESLLPTPEGRNLVNERHSNIPPVISLIDDLLASSSQINLVRLILSSGRDALGAYFYANSPEEKARGEKVPRIEIYWQIIGLVADELRVGVEDLTAVVLAHEQAHAYTHRGSDANGGCWDDRSFEKSDEGLVEGLAQYYTERIADNLSTDGSRCREAYDRLLEEQPPNYQTHRQWVTENNPEAVRLAMLVIRRHPIGKLEAFNATLRPENERLHSK